MRARMLILPTPNPNLSNLYAQTFPNIILVPFSSTFAIFLGKFTISPLPWPSTPLPQTRPESLQTLTGGPPSPSSKNPYHPMPPKPPTKRKPLC
ncbi:hypothetical protein BC829DRAFT_383814 [Chytridium lagenaria]|nr:hypothetical protein BC829DRAFT_383814 [Chytridium lagenaria]